MKKNFDIIRYKELVEKENHLNQQNNSLIYQNREEFAELVKYGASIESQIFYQRREEYYLLISEYIKKIKTISHLPLIKQSRLSVMPIDFKSWKIIYKMGKINSN